MRAPVTPRKIIREALRPHSRHEGWPGMTADQIVGKLRAKGFEIVHVGHGDDPHVLVNRCYTGTHRYHTRRHAPTIDGYASIPLSVAIELGLTICKRCEADQ